MWKRKIRRTRDTTTPQSSALLAELKASAPTAPDIAESAAPETVPPTDETLGQHAPREPGTPSPLPVSNSRTRKQLDNAEIAEFESLMNAFGEYRRTLPPVTRGIKAVDAPWDSWLWELVALITAGEDEDGICRRLVAVEPGHRMEHLLSWARLVVAHPLILNSSLVHHGGLGRTPLDVCAALIEREEARTSYRSQPEDDEARRRRVVADAAFSTAMLNWARWLIAQTEGRRDPRSAVVWEEFVREQQTQTAR